MALTTNNLTGFGGGSGSLLIYDIIQELGLNSGLVACWDVADLSCYSGSGDDWVDRVDPVNNIWVRGNGIAGQKPTFNGTAGVPTESTYWSFDGGDFFIESGLMTFATDWHKNNGQFSFLFGMYVVGSTGTQVLFTPDGFGSSYTVYISLNSSEEVAVSFNDGTTDSTPSSCSLNSWNIFSGSYNEASSPFNFNLNGTASTDPTSNKTATGDPADPYNLMASQVGANEVANGTRLAFVAFWSTAIGATALQSLYTTLKARRLPSAP